MSAIGSVIVMGFVNLSRRGSPRARGFRAYGEAVWLAKEGLPGRLGHAGQLAAVRHLPQADPAQAELAVDRVRPAAALAAGVAAHANFGFAAALMISAFFAMLSSP
jgi:hypothetical protein